MWGGGPAFSWRFTESFEIRQVLQPARGPLACDERGPANEGDSAAEHVVLNAPSPRLVEVWHPADFGQQINSSRWKANLHNGAAVCEILLADIQVAERGTECCQRPPDARGIFQGWFDPDIQVLGSSRHAVNGHGVRTDNEEPCLFLQEREEDVGPVVRHDGRVTRTGISDRR